MFHFEIANDINNLYLNKFKCNLDLRNDEFWASLSRLNSVVMDQIRLEESTNSNKDKTEL